MQQSELPFNSLCTAQIHLAERELSTFLAAVVELFGADEARVSIEDWLNELKLTDVSRRSTRRDWRTITIRASVRLANRLNARSQGGNGRIFSFTLPVCRESSLPGGLTTTS